MLRRLAAAWFLVVLAACGDSYPAGHGTDGDGGTGPGPDDAPPIVIGESLQLLDGGGLTSHALADEGATVVLVATRDHVAPEGASSSTGWARLDDAGVLDPERPIQLFFDEPGGGLALGAVAVAGRGAFLAMATAAFFVTQEFELGTGNSTSGGWGGAVGRVPPRPLRPSAVSYGTGFLAFHNGWGWIEAELDDRSGSTSYVGSFAGHDPHVSLVNDEAWLGWNEETGARAGRLVGTDPPRPQSPVELGAAANGPILAAGPGHLLALTWGETLDAHLLALDPPSVLATATVATGPLSGRPAAIPWAGGFLVLWADAAGTRIRGRLLDPAGAPLGPADGFLVVSLDEPISFEPTHAIGDDTGAWLTWETSAGLYGARLNATP